MKLEERTKEIRKHLANGDIKSASKELSGILEIYYFDVPLDIQSLVLENPETLDHHMANTNHIDPKHIEKTASLIEIIKHNYEDRFQEFVSRIKDRDALFELVRSDYTKGFGRTFTAETAHPLIGHERMCDVVISMLDNLGDHVSAKSHIRVLRSVRPHLISEEFAIIDYIQGIKPDMKVYWDKCRAKVVSFIELTKDRLDEISYKDVGDLTEEYGEDEIRLGVLVDLIHKDNSLFRGDPVFEDLQDARFIGETKMLTDDLSYGPIATAQFLRLVIERDDTYKPNQLADIIKKSDSFAHQVKGLSLEEAKSLISIDPSNSVFHKIKWEDRRIMRELASQELGL